jgi:DNA polymerase-3 subunit alpha
MSYVNLHSHSDYSNLRLIDSINKIPDMLTTAKNIGLNGLAITDHEALSGHLKAIEFVAGKQKDDESWKDFKLVLGNEIYLCRNGLNKDTVERGERYPHFILLALDNEGHRQLREISSRAWERSFMMFLKRVPTWYSDLEDIIMNNQGHVIATSACIGNILGMWFLNKEFDKVEEHLVWCQKVFGEENFFLEMSPAAYEEQIEYNKYLIELSKKYNIPLTIATDAHYGRPEDFPIHEAFLKSKEEDRETADFYKYTYLMTADEIYELMTYVDKNIIDEALENTNRIADRVMGYDLYRPQTIPRLPDARNESNFEFYLKTARINPKYEYINKYVSSEYEDDRYGVFLVLDALKQLGLEGERKERHLNQIELELEEMWVVSDKIGQRLMSYFLTIRVIIQKIWDEVGSLTCPGRGSGPASLVCCLLGICDGDPLEQGFDLWFYRFIHRERAELADWDFDSEASKRGAISQMVYNMCKGIGGDAVSVCTFGTEGSRSALLTACRGMGLSNDIGQYLSSLIGQNRGFSYSLEDTYNGNEDKGIPQSKEFKKEIDKYPNLYKTACAISGLVTRLGQHACGMLLYNGNVYDYNALATTPSGARVSQFDLGDSEKMGSIKYDFLSTDALDKIHTCMDLLLKDGLIEWQGSLRATYNKYLHPDVLDRETKEMWEMLNEGKIISAFQMDSVVAKQTLASIHPRSLLELAATNSLMRLVPEKGHKSPAEEYLEYKLNPQKLYNEVYALNGTDKEKKILYEYLKKYNGVLESQENMMQITMIPEFTNFSFSNASKLRKIVAKKKLKEVDAFREFFIQTGLDNGCSKDILTYIWDVQIKRQLGYSFNLTHCTYYSLIGLQEMNLAYHYPSIYWATAVMTVEAGALDIEDSSGTNYAKVSAAIGRVTSEGYKVELPLINEADFGFVPDAKNNSIVYGLKGITEVSDDFVKTIIENRPYSSPEDFVEKCQPQKKQMINLIKAGAFTEFEDRRLTMNNYLTSISPKKARITLQNMNTLIDYRLIPNELISYVYLYNFNKYIKKGETPSGFKIDARAMDFLAKNFPDIDIASGFLDGKLWKKTYENEMNGLKTWLKENEEHLIKEIQRNDVLKIWEQYCVGNDSAWEMDVLGFYHSGHELANINVEDVVSINNLQEGDYKHVVTIAGTVLGKEPYKHMVTILTPDGVVDLKFTGEAFANYNKTISEVVKGEKKTLEKSWFVKGTLVLATGFKSGEVFRVRHLSRVLEIDDLGNVKTTKYRYGGA